MKHADMHCINESQNMRTLDIQILQITQDNPYISGQYNPLQIN